MGRAARTIRLSGPIAGLLVCSLAPAARADGPGDARLAQALFEEARSLMEQKKYAEACPKLKESQRLDPGGGTLLNLATCHEREGKTATALDEYHEALTVATKDGRKDREQIARAGIEKLEREVPRVTVLVPHPVAGIDVKLDTTPMVQAAWGVATPVDPGPHTVTATAPGYRTVKVHVDVRAGERKAIEVPAATKEEAAAAPAPETYEQGSGEKLIILSKTDPNPVFWTGLGVGLAAAAISGITGVLTITNTLDANSNCSEKRTYCKDADAKDALSNAQTFGWISTITLGIAVVGLTVAIIAPSRKLDVRKAGDLHTVSLRF